MRSIVTFVFLVASGSLIAQTVPHQLKALNSYVDYANQSATEVTSVVSSIIEYYPAIGRKNWSPRYVYPGQADDYYFNEAIKQNKALGETGFPSVTRAFQELRTAAEKIDEKCKALDTYHKLEDYKQDNYAKAEVLIRDIQTLLKEYKRKQQSLQTELEKIYKKITSATSDNAYRQAEFKMLKTIATEKSIIDLWTFNIKESVHTGWPVEKLQQSIPVTDAELTALKNYSPSLKYPASSMWTQFQSSLSSFLDIKRRGLDEYNFEAKKSDKHSNNLYLELINYFNGTLISDYNAFLKFSEGDGYFGLKTMRYVPAFEIRTEIKTPSIDDAQPFKDIPHTPLQLTDQKNSISKPVADALYNYIEFINETWRQTRNLMLSLSGFNSSAAYFKTLDSFERRAPLHFEYKDFQLPLSYYQKTITSGSSLPPSQAKSLNDQCEVLLNILKEMDDQSASLEIEVKEKKYEQDHLEKVYAILERQAVLFTVWDEKKETLYRDVRSIYNSFPSKTSNSWQVSGKALRELTDLGHDAIFQAKAYYKGDSTITIKTDQIDAVLREVIAKEYDNMKGIQKIGRNNGLCPYTPYEDLPETSRRLSEEFKKLKPAKSSSGYSHPYHAMVYLYNDIVNDYNKFCELSTTVFHLPAILQPELFSLKYPDSKSEKQKGPNSPNQSQVKETTKQPALHLENGNPKSPQVSENKLLIKHDTVFIEKERYHLSHRTERRAAFYGGIRHQQPGIVVGCFRFDESTGKNCPC
jgi:Ca-activated chloride channel family protein